jgi:hypothetical protein
MQCDEPWAGVGTKQTHGEPHDPADAAPGEHGDHVAFALTHRLVLRVVPGTRTAAQTDALGHDGHRRPGRRLLDL